MDAPPGPTAPAPPGPPPPGAAAPAPPPDGKRLRRILLVAIPAAVIVVAVVTYLLLPGIMVRRAARSLGVSVSWDSLEIGTDTVRLRGARLTLSGVDGLVIAAERLRVGRRGFDATSVDAERVNVTVEGSATDRVLELTAWSHDHDDAFRIPASGSDVRVAWRASDGDTRDTPWLTLSGGSAKTDGKTGRLVGTTAVGGVPLGQVSTTFAADASGVTIEMGKAGSGEAPITARLGTKTKPPRVEITLRPVKLSSLGSALGLSLPAPGAVASGRAELVLGKRGSAEEITGSASLQLEGWVPAHPKEMNGVLAGKKTSVTTRLAVAENRTKVTLSEMVVRMGRLELKGAGTVTRAKDHAVGRLDLAGPIACAELVRSAAGSGPLGGFLGDVAGSAVEGTVKVNVSVEADSRDLRAAKITPRVGVGCGLKMPGF